MNHRLSWLVVAAVLVLVAGDSAARAEGVLVANVPFPFIVGRVTHSAGEYRLSINENGSELTVTPMKGEASVALVETRLAVRDKASKTDHLVFDKIGNTYYLSELWLPGEDGYLMHSAKGAHTHEIVKVGHKAK